MEYAALGKRLEDCDLTAIHLFTGRQQWVYRLPPAEIQELEESVRTVFRVRKAVELDAVEQAVVHELARALAVANAFGLTDPTDPDHHRTLGFLAEEYSPKPAAGADRP